MPYFDTTPCMLPENLGTKGIFLVWYVSRRKKNREKKPTKNLGGCTEIDAAESDKCYTLSNSIRGGTSKDTVEQHGMKSWESLIASIAIGLMEYVKSTGSQKYDDGRIFFNFLKSLIRIPLALPFTEFAVRSPHQHWKTYRKGTRHVQRHFLIPSPSRITKVSLFGYGQGFWHLTAPMKVSIKYVCL